MKRNSNRNLLITTIIFSILIMSCIFFLTLAVDWPVFYINYRNGVLGFDKTKTVQKKNNKSYGNRDVNLIFTSGYLQDDHIEDTVSITMDGKGLVLDLYFEDEETKVVFFKIKNVSNTKAILHNIIHTEHRTDGMIINWPDLNNLILSPNEESIEYRIDIIRHGISIHRDASIVVELNYQEYVY